MTAVAILAVSGWVLALFALLWRREEPRHLRAQLAAQHARAARERDRATAEAARCRAAEAEVEQLREDLRIARAVNHAIGERLNEKTRRRMGAH